LLIYSILMQKNAIVRVIIGSGLKSEGYVSQRMLHSIKKNIDEYDICEANDCVRNNRVGHFAAQTR